MEWRSLPQACPIRGPGHDERMTRPARGNHDHHALHPARHRAGQLDDPGGDVEPGPGRFGAADVYYPASGGARAALVVAADLRYSVILSEHVADLDRVEPYQPGSFYRRELPALRRVLADVESLDLLVIDGYVDLDPQGRPGLGTHLHHEFAIPVIGVAKTAYHTATHAIPVRRGTATRPLYVTAIGVDPGSAVTWVTDMTGVFRLPDALRRADTLSRSRVWSNS